MDTFDAIVKRRSIRKYQETTISADTLKRIATAGLMAPSASNMQPWNFVFVTDTQKIKKIGKGKQGFISESSLIIVGTVDKRVNVSWNVVDVAIALQNMVLYCTAIGLGTCWVGAFSKRAVRETCKVPETHDIVALITVGKKHPDFPDGDFFRKDMDEAFFLDDFTRPFTGDD